MQLTARILSGSLVSVLILTSCGRVKKEEKKEDEGLSADALSGGSEVKWDQDYSLTGNLTGNSAMTSRFNYIFERELSLIATSPANMRVHLGDATTECSNGSTLKGIYFTLSTADGSYIRTTDNVEQPATPVDISAFPGRVPAGAYTLIVRAYADGPCRVDVTFNFPSPDPALLPASSDKTLDADLVGSWHGEDDSVSITKKKDLVFTTGHTMSWTEKRGDLVRADFTAKYNVDTKSVPRRALLTVTQVKIASADMSVSVGSSLRCIYSGQPSGAATALYWQCSDLNDAAFPIDLDDAALEFYRNGSASGGIWNSEIAKGGVVSLAIPDNDLAGAQNVFEFRADGARVVDLSIEFSLQHPSLGDLRVTLIHPDGSEVALFERETLSGATLIRSYGFAGTRLAALDSLKGKVMNGKWRLKVADESPSDTGSLTNAKLTIRY